MPTVEPSPQAAPLAVDEAEMPPEKVVVTTAKVPVKNVVLKGGGSGLPNIHHVQFEQRTDRPGLSVWYAPEGNNAARKTKTYLGYVGKRLLAEWQVLPNAQREQTIRQWVADRRAGKGVA